MCFHIFFSYGLYIYFRAYRAPELFDVQSSCVLDERTDMWSLGCLLFAMAFGGRSPFDLPNTNTGGSVGMSMMYIYDVCNV